MQLNLDVNWSSIILWLTLIIKLINTWFALVIEILECFWICLIVFLWNEFWLFDLRLEIIVWNRFSSLCLFWCFKM